MHQEPVCNAKHVRRLSHLLPGILHFQLFNSLHKLFQFRRIHACSHLEFHLPQSIHDVFECRSIVWVICPTISDQISECQKHRVRNLRSRVFYSHQIRDLSRIRTLRKYWLAGQEFKKNQPERENIACAKDSVLVALWSAMPQCISLLPASSGTSHPHFCRSHCNSDNHSTGPPLKVSLFQKGFSEGSVPDPSQD
jgi:hypothetical protein